MIIAKIIACNPYYLVGWAMPTLRLLRRCKICVYEDLGVGEYWILDVRNVRIIAFAN